MSQVIPILNARQSISEVEFQGVVYVLRSHFSIKGHFVPAVDHEPANHFHASYGIGACIKELFLGYLIYGV